MFPYKQYDAIRSDKRKTNYWVAKAIGINPANMTNWKQGKSEPKYDKIVKIANVLEVPVEDLIEKQEETEDDCAIGCE